MRRIRTRLPTCLSVGFGGFLVSMIDSSSPAFTIAMWMDSTPGPFETTSPRHGIAARNYEQRNLCPLQLRCAPGRQLLVVARRCRRSALRLFLVHTEPPPHHRDEREPDHDGDRCVADTGVKCRRDRQR